MLQGKSGHKWLPEAQCCSPDPSLCPTNVGWWDEAEFAIPGPFTPSSPAHGKHRGQAGSRRCYFKPPGWVLDPSTPDIRCVSQAHTPASPILYPLLPPCTD